MALAESPKGIRNGQRTAANSDVDTEDLLYKEIGAIPLLSKEETEALWKTVGLGVIHRRAREAGAIIENVAVMTDRITDGETALSTLIRHNLRLVVSTADKYGSPHIKLEDRFQTAIEGVYKIHDKLRLDSDASFSTVAVWQMRRALTEQGLRESTYSPPVTPFTERFLPVTSPPAETAALRSMAHKNLPEIKQQIIRRLKTCRTRNQYEMMLVSIQQAEQGEDYSADAIARQIGKEQTNVAHTMTSARKKIQKNPELLELLDALHRDH